ncbi:hypothetical protein AAFF_G00352650 [Aldrovandia affinis]|uniref:Uncharacterized protein n=1 Tax=Aldrovandia affinis TaxID=143900 RepID=A0AAD7SJ73_9TELE|nr:hypothetical protein AAFF_G00352650 [Aldrovandia affinis]
MPQLDANQSAPQYRSKRRRGAVSGDGNNGATEIRLAFLLRITTKTFRQHLCFSELRGGLNFSLCNPGSAQRKGLVPRLPLRSVLPNINADNVICAGAPPAPPPKG